MPFILDYDEAISLDAEELAEGGIADGYESVLQKLRKFVESPVKIEESRDDEIPSYSVRCVETVFNIYGPELEEEDCGSWGRATVALFSIVNAQLERSSHRLYAINSGNDLFGIFLTPAQALESRKSLPKASDRPYLPSIEGPYYGQFH